MRLVFFVHSLRSCWNHGNAHFLRGVARALLRAGHDVRVHVPADGWSAANLVADGHDDRAYRGAYPELRETSYGPDFDLDAALDGADAAVVHEWNDPALVARIGAHPSRAAKLFHDTHHRAVSDPDAIRAFELSGYDGVLAFGAVLADVYRRWGHRAWVWHEAADITHFRPPATPAPPRAGAVWIGNWGDGERSAELETYLLGPARAAGLPLDIHGVRYPPEALATLDRHGARWHGWLANAAAPAVFARHLLTVHVPRRHYVEALPGIPTIRVFEALACGIPLLSAPWDDAEGLFRPGDYLVARDGAEMARHMRDVAGDPALAADLAARGLETVRARHSCAHRAAELVDLVRGLAAPERVAA